MKSVVLFLLEIGPKEIVCVIKFLYHSPHPPVFSPHSFSLGDGFWWHLSTSVAWGCCNMSVSLILKQKLIKRKVLIGVFRYTAVGCVAAENSAPFSSHNSCLKSLVSWGNHSSYSQSQVFTVVIFCLDFVTLTLLSLPHSHSYLLGGLIYSSCFLGATCL